MSENKKFYSFFNANKCVGKEGKEYISCTVALTLANIEHKTTEGGKELVTARACINNRGKIISSMLDKEVKESEDGAIWCDVTFWEDKASRFQKFLKDREKVRVCLCGTLSLREFEKADGTPGQRVTINAMDWFALQANG